MSMWLTFIIIAILVLGSYNVRRSLRRAGAPVGRYVSRGALLGFGTGLLVSGYAVWIDYTGAAHLSLVRVAFGLVLFVLLGMAATYPWRQQLKVWLKSAS